MLQLLRRLISFFRRDRLDDELAEEIRLHLDLRRRALIDDGMLPADADHEARRQFGNVIAIRERSRDHWGSVAVNAFFQDVKFGTRMLARSPGLSAVIVLTIAFGAGLNGAVFLQFNDLFLRPPDLTDPERLVWLDDGDPRMVVPPIRITSITAIESRLSSSRCSRVAIRPARRSRTVDRRWPQPLRRDLPRLASPQETISMCYRRRPRSDAHSIRPRTCRRPASSSGNSTA